MGKEKGIQKIKKKMIPLALALTLAFNNSCLSYPKKADYLPNGEFTYHMYSLTTYGYRDDFGDAELNFLNVRNKPYMNLEFLLTEPRTESRMLHNEFHFSKEDEKILWWYYDGTRYSEERKTETMESITLLDSNNLNESYMEEINDSYNGGSRIVYAEVRNLGIERINVPAGSFDAIRLELRREESGYLSPTLLWTMWLAPDVGIVKHEEHGIGILMGSPTWTHDLKEYEVE